LKDSLVTPGFPVVDHFDTAIIAYTLEALADAKEWFKDVSSKQPLIIHPQLNMEIKAIRETRTAQVVQCCCFNKGSATMTVNFDKNAYVSGETANIICEGKNDSDEDFHAIKVKLIRRVTMKSNFGHTQVLTTELVRQVYEGLKAHTEASGPLARQVPLPLVDKKGGVFVPESHGELVDCTYWAEVEFDIPYAPDLIIKLPITIYAPQPPPGWGVAAPPAFWNPDPKNVYSPKMLSLG